MKTNGFTLIELIIVIVILGLLAAFALPKFSHLEDDAKRAVVENTAGSLQSAVKLAQLKWRTSDEQRTNVALSGGTGNQNFINMVDFSAFGCPVQHWRINTETNPSANNSTDCLTVFLLAMSRCTNNQTNCGNQPDEQFEHHYLGSGICEYRYRDNTDYRIQYDTLDQGCAVTTSGL